MTTPTAHGLVVFGEDWGRHPSSTQHLVRRLAADRQVVWVNSIGLRRPRPNGSDLVRVASKLLRRPKAASRGVTPPERMSIVPPMAVSWPGSSLAATVNRHVVGWQVRRVMARRNMRRPILWTSLPSAMPLVGSLGERAVVYYCGDDFGSLAGVDHEPVMAMERALVDRADLIIAASETLAERLPASRTLLLPHGADVDLFRRPATRAQDLPDNGPIAGFYGSISDWIDVRLLADTAALLADWTFVMIGDIRTDVTALRALPNVRFLGPRAHDVLPSYTQHWTVSLLPFRDCPQIQACNPLKLREYLATGTAIAATPFPALAPYTGLIEAGQTADGFAAAIRRAAEDRRRNGHRRSAVAHESWDARSVELGNALAAL